MPKWTKKIPAKHFILFQFVILFASLFFVGLLYYILNIQYQLPSHLYSSSGGPVTSLPKSLRIDLEQPDDNVLVYSSSIIVSGKTAPNKSVFITTDTNDLVITSSASGDFSTVLPLDAGINKITAVVFDLVGDSRETARTVYFSKEKLQ